MGGLVPNACEVVATFGEEVGLMDDDGEIFWGEDGTSLSAFFKYLMVVMAYELEADELGEVGLACGKSVDFVEGLLVGSLA